MAIAYKHICDAAATLEAQDPQLRGVREVLFDAQIMVFDPVERRNAIQVDPVEINEVLLALPFERLWLETADEQSVIHFQLTTPEGKSLPPTYVYGLLVDEIKPGVLDMYACIAAGTNHEHNTFIKVPRDTPLFIAIKHGLIELLQRLDRCSTGTVTGNFGKVKLRDKKRTCRIRKIRDYIVIKPKNYNRSNTTFNGAAVEWSHKWRVRGHWRKLNGGLGKDRAGKRCLNGFTWVKPHTKGPEDAILIEKVREIR